MAKTWLVTGAHDRLLVAALDRAGFFEELTTEQVRADRDQPVRPDDGDPCGAAGDAPAAGGLVISISSGAGVSGGRSASKFALEGWMEALAGEVRPFGIRTMIVEPSCFRTELLTPASTTYGQQAGDPAKLASALVGLADSTEPPLRWAAGGDVVESVEDKAQLLLAHRGLSTSLAHEAVA